MEIPLGGISLLIAIMAVWYGACMGFYSGFRPTEAAATAAPGDRAKSPEPAKKADTGKQAESEKKADAGKKSESGKEPEGDGAMAKQWFADTVKVPALFFLTLAVTFPSLYVFNALVGSRLSLVAVLRLLVASLAVNVAVLASLGPIVAFFSVSTTSYPFILLLNVLVFSVSGFLGLAFLLQTLRRLTMAHFAVPPTKPQAGRREEPAAAGSQPPPPEGKPASPGAEGAQAGETLEDSLRRLTEARQAAAVWSTAGRAQPAAAHIQMADGGGTAGR